jgi:hypothetical protein
MARPQNHAGHLLRLDDDLHLDRLRPCLLPGSRRPRLVRVACSFLLGLGGANFIVYSFWLPEQYGTECRASAFAFTTDVGRFVAAGFTFLVGAGIRHFQTLGTPVALTGFAFVIGILLLPFGEETKGKPLPA